MILDNHNSPYDKSALEVSVAKQMIDYWFTRTTTNQGSVDQSLRSRSQRQLLDSYEP